MLAALGTLVFLNVYAPQSLLPLLARDLNVSEVGAGSVVGATTLAIALVSPLSGAVSDALGRRRVILIAFLLLTLPALLATQAHTLAALDAARFLQGLVIPLVMVSCTAYAAEEYAGPGVARAITAYVTGTVLGGFAGRFLSGVTVDAVHDWRAAFWLLAATNLLGALLALALPASRHFRPVRDLRAVRADLTLHLHNRALLGTLAVGFVLLFTLVSAFTFVVLHLAAPPYRLSSAGTGGVFAVYLLGVVITPLASRLMAVRGSVRTFTVGVAFSLAGLGLTLLPSLPWIVVGLALASSGVFVGQAAALSAVQASVTRARSLATGLYNLAYYGGGAAATVIGGLAYARAGWAGAVACSAVALLLSLAVGLVTWRHAPGTPDGDPPAR
ncbi:MFS transporter [Deinococcus aquiradiocola]|uniref:MFS transporter n=2 Tax=Deinococcus aquiradiocola TaxID=393059 RepID=A0A917P3K6_9DEIO|nr:MFS transporter [Deinococcus aquiradiocola]